MSLLSCATGENFLKLISWMCLIEFRSANLHIRNYKQNDISKNIGANKRTETKLIVYTILRMHSIKLRNISIRVYEI